MIPFLKRVNEGKKIRENFLVGGKIFNLTQHTPTKEQSEAGVFDAFSPATVKELLTFKSLPSKEEIQERAFALATVAVSANVSSAMIGGAPFLMSALEKALREKGINPFYAFSKRESIERKKEDGSIVKTTVFRHLGFVEPPV